MITNRDTLITAMAGGLTTWLGSQLSGTSASGINTVVGSTSWIGGHRPGAVPATLSAPALCTSSTAGALPMPVLSAGNQYYIGTMSAFSTVVGHLWVTDRLSHVKLDATLTTTQTFTLTRPARSASAIGVTAFLEYLVAPQAVTAPVVTLSYTNENGVAGRTGTIGGSYNGNFPAAGGTAGATIPMQLQAGDRGVSSVQSLTAATAMTGSTYLLTLGRIVATGYVNNAYTSVNYGFYDLGGVGLGADPCLYLQSFCNGPLLINASMRIIQG